MTTPAYSPARRAGDLLFVSGQLPLAAGKLVDGDIGDQTRQTLRNLEQVLLDHGAALNDVIRCTVFLASMTDWAAMNEVYRECFDEPLPARTAVGGTLIPGALVEIDAIAHVGSGSK